MRLVVYGVNKAPAQPSISSSRIVRAASEVTQICSLHDFFSALTSVPFAMWLCLKIEYAECQENGQRQRGRMSA